MYNLSKTQDRYLNWYIITHPPTFLKYGGQTICPLSTPLSMIYQHYNISEEKSGMLYFLEGSRGEKWGQGNSAAL